MVKHKCSIQNCFNKVEEKFGKDILEKYSENIVELYNKTNVEVTYSSLKTIIRFIEKELDEWVYRFDEIGKLKKDSMTLRSFKLRFGDIAGEKEYNRRKKTVAFTLEKCVLKYGEVEGKKYFDEINKKKAINRKEYYIEKYGEEKGLEEFKKYTEKRVKTRKSRDYRYDTVSLKFFTTRYGTEDGTRRYYEAQNSRYKRFKESTWIEKYGQELGSKLYDEYKKELNRHMNNMSKIAYESGSHNKLYSKVSQELFFKVLDNLPEEIRTECKFAEHNGEETFVLRHPNYPYCIVDFKCGNSIIEFDGDYWHSSEKQKEKDALKTTLLEKKGYKILRIRDSFYEKNKIESIALCIKHITENK